MKVKLISSSYRGMDPAIGHVFEAELWQGTSSVTITGEQLDAVIKSGPHTFTRLDIESNKWCFFPNEYEVIQEEL